MLRVDLAALSDGPVEVAGSIEPGAPLLEGLDFQVRGPVRVSGHLSAAGPGQYYLRGTLEVDVTGGCRRCLRDIPIALNERLALVFTENPDTDDPAAYVIPERAGQIQLDEMVREQMILAVPDYPLCREDCRGLCATCGKDLNDGPCDCRQEPDPRWAPLGALRSQVKNREN